MNEDRSTAERWEKVQGLFHEAALLPGDEREAFLLAACGADAELLTEIRELLAEDREAGSLLDRDIAQIASEIVGPASPTDIPKEGFGPYRLETLLGEGGMGVVYLARREDLGSRVAIKVLRDAWLSPSRRERFTTEQRVLARLQHPAIARLYDADTLPDGTPWFAMEYVEGAPLTDHCRGKACSIRESLELLRSVCEAVQYAHSHAIIHRDLKPTNILVKQDGTVRLLDFGIAKHLGEEDAPFERTRTGLRLLTPAYAAPEQIRGEPVGVQTDIYSLGVILYELLAGRLPFDLSRKTPAEAGSILLGSDPERPSVAAARITGGRLPEAGRGASPEPGRGHSPGNGRESAPAAAAAPAAGRRAASIGRAAWADLDVLCLTAMNADPGRRYRSVEALIRDIDHYLKGEPLESRPESVRYRLGKFVGRKRGPLTAAAIGLAAVAGLLAFFTVRLAIARNEALAEAARTERIQRFMLNLFQGGDETAGPSEGLRVVTLLDRGEQEARVLDEEPVVQAELYQTLGTIYQKLGRLDRADSLLRSALERRRALFGADHAQVAESLVALGLLRADQAELEEAERLVREGLEMSKRHAAAGHPSLAKAMTALGMVLENRGEYDRAIEVLDEAVRLQSAAGEETTDLSATLTELANSHFYAGRYDVSESLNRRVLEMDRRLYGERHPHVADDLINLGAIDFEKGRYQDAESSYRQALDLIRSWYGDDHQETASAMTMLGRALVAAGRDEEAVLLLRGALGVQERVYGAVHPRVASALNELGNAALRQGKLDEAEAAYGRMAEIYRSVHGERHELVGVAMANIGSVRLKRSDFPGAERQFREALALFAGQLPAGHLNVGIARIKLGRALVGESRHAEAEGELLGGYAILIGQTDPSASWLQAARADLVTVYEKLGRPEDAARFQAEQDGAAASASGGSGPK